MQQDHTKPFLDKINHKIITSFKLIISSALVTISLSSCSLFRPYKIQIQQGQNFPAATIKQLKPNMTKHQVQFLLGDPNANSPFNKNKWIYVYSNQHNYLPTSETNLILTFDKQDKLVNISGDGNPPKKLTYRTINTPS